MDWPELIKRLIELVLPRSDDNLGSPAKPVCGSTSHHRILPALFTSKSPKPDDGSSDATR
jgi:hypothetical protein